MSITFSWLNLVVKKFFQLQGTFDTTLKPGQDFDLPQRSLAVRLVLKRTYFLYRHLKEIR